MKRCRVCLIEKPLDKFARDPTRPDKLQQRCRACMRIYQAEHYARDKEYYAAKRKCSRVRARDIIRELKRMPCADCGIEYPPYVMQFDHLGDKEFGLATVGNRGMSRERIEAEASKCDVVCANCHAERSHQRVIVKRAPLVEC